MSKHTKVPAIKVAASLAARQIIAMEKNAKEVHDSETERRDCRLQLLSSPSEFRAVIKNEKFTLQVEGDTFAITSRD